MEKISDAKEGDIPGKFVHLADSSAEIEGHGKKQGVVRPLSKKKKTSTTHHSIPVNLRPFTPVSLHHSIPVNCQQLTPVSPYLRVLISPHHICQK